MGRKKPLIRAENPYILKKIGLRDEWNREVGGVSPTKPESNLSDQRAAPPLLTPLAQVTSPEAAPAKITPLSSIPKLLVPVELLCGAAETQ